MQIETVNWSIVMEIKKAEIKDLDVVVKMKMEMFIEVGSISLLQDNAEKKIYEKYKELFDLGAITEEEFVAKKKQLLGL